MTVTQVDRQKRTLMPPHDQHGVIFHDPEKCTEYFVNENARLTLFDMAVGAGQRVSTVKIILGGEGARADVYALFWGGGKESLGLAHKVIHRAPYTTSRIVARGVLGGRAKAVYTGDIYIPQGVPGCDGRQEIHTLMLSRDAHIDAVPHLEIGNNDVRCSHSVGVTYIDEMKKFYLESRGMSEKEAVQAVVSGHCQEILERIEDKVIRTKLENTMKALI